MPQFTRLLILAAAVSLILAACGSVAPTAPAPASTGAAPAATLVPTAAPARGGTPVNGSGITANKPGQTLNVKVGDLFDVRLGTIPRSGFAWQTEDLDTSILMQLGDPVYEPDSSPNAVGGTVVVKFKVVGPGTTPLTLIYVSSPNGGAPLLYSQSFGITVNAK